MGKKHTCPRRAENGMDREDGPFKGSGKNLDTYVSGRGIIGQGRGCSYCGSMSPDDFMEAVREGAQIGPTDKSYKVYVEGYNKNGSNGGKFYTAHLSQEQGSEFRELYGEGKVNIGYPGHFYQPLYIPMLPPKEVE